MLSDLKFVVGNVGNTHSEFAVFDGAEITDLDRLSTKELLAGALPKPFETFPQYPILGATVVPEVVPLPSMSRVIWGHAGMCGDMLDFTPVDPFTLGADRVGNAVAAVHLLELPVLVVDFGTAITFELITADRVFQGGAIMPGRTLMRKALSLDTAQLPEISLTGDVPAAPARTTEDAIRLGVDGGAIGAVDRLIRELTSAVPNCTVVAVGGDREAFMASDLPLTAGPEDFTLKGIGFIAMDVF